MSGTRACPKPLPDLFLRLCPLPLGGCPAGSGQVWTVYSRGARPQSVPAPGACGPGPQARPLPSGCVRALQLEAHAGRSAQGP